VRARVSSSGKPTGQDEGGNRPDPVDDPEAAPQTPSGTLAAGAMPAPAIVSAGRAASAAEIWRLSWPIMLSQVLVTAVGLVDIAMVGRLGAGAVAAVGYATQFFFMTQSALFAVGFACVALMARSIGAGDPSSARRALAASLLVAVGTALVVATAVLVAPRALLGLLSADAHVVDLCIPYLWLVLGSTVLLAISLVLESGLRAVRDTVTPMRIAAVVAAVKLSLNAVLIFGVAGFPRMELVGAGVATVVSQVLGLVLFLTAVGTAPESSPVRLSLGDMRASGGLLRSVTRLAAPGVAERIILNLALLAYFAILGTYGTAAVAAYTVGVRALSFSWIPGIGFQGAVATLVAYSLGAGKRDMALRTGRVAVAMALGVAVVLGVVAAGAHASIARAFTSDPDTIAALGPFLLFLAAAQPLLQVHFTLAGVHRGAGDTWTPLLAATAGNWAFRVPMAFVLARVFEVELVWLWAPILFDHAARALWLGRSFRRRAWMEPGGELAG
jgi:putative MATE family efflux protein